MATIFVATFTSLAANAAEQPDLERAQELIAGGDPAQAFELLAPFEPQYAGDLQYDYLLARAALDSGQPSLASFIYERILAVEPNYVGVRLENGRAYLELGNYARAQQEFETVLRFENLPNDLRESALQYARITKEQTDPQKTFFNHYAEYGFGYDNNINSALSEAVVALPGGFILELDRLSTKLGDFYHSVNAGTEVAHAINDNWSVFAGLNYLGRFHQDETFFDYYDANASAGVRYGIGTHQFDLSGRYGRFFFNDEALRDVAGGTLRWAHVLDDTNKVSASASFDNYSFDNPLLQSNDFDAYGLSTAWDHGFADGRWLASLSATTNYENAVGGRLDGNKVLGGLRASVQGSVSDTVGVFASVGAQRSNYRSYNTLFNVRRHDTYYSASGGVSWSFHPNWSLRPQVSWSRNNSNVPLNVYSRLDVSLNLRASF